MKTLAYLECSPTHVAPGRLQLANQRVLTKAEIRPVPPVNGAFHKWLDWAEPGEAYQMRNGIVYICIQLTVEE